MRLAHVHMELNEPQRAIPLLEQLLAQKTLPEYRYVGLNLLADALVRTGAVDRGIEMYTAARKLMPSAQSAYIGHARALRMAGRAGDAAVVVSAMLARPVHDDDPWARYPLGFEIELTQFDALRARVQDQ